MQKQQQQQRILSRLNGVDGGPQADAMTNGDYVAAASAAPLTERLGSGQSGGGLPASLPKRVTPLQSSAAPQSLGFGNGLGQVIHQSICSCTCEMQCGARCTSNNPAPWM